MYKERRNLHTSASLYLSTGTGFQAVCEFVDPTPNNTCLPYNFSYPEQKVATWMTQCFRNPPPTQKGTSADLFRIPNALFSSVYVCSLLYCQRLVVLRKFPECVSEIDFGNRSPSLRE